MSGRNAVFLLESTEESGVILKSHLMAYILQQGTCFDQRLCRNQPPLGNAAVEADTQTFAECLGYGAVTDIEMLCHLRQGNSAGEILFHIS